MCSILQKDPAAGGDFKCAQRGCRACQDALIRQHTGLIHAVLRRVAHAGVPYADLVQVGRLALWRAVRQAHRPEGNLPAPEPPDPWTHPRVHEAVLNAIYGLDGQSPGSRAALGRRWGLSGERIRQLHDQALLPLRHPGRQAQLYRLCARESRALGPWTPSRYRRGLSCARCRPSSAGSMRPASWRSFPGKPSTHICLSRWRRWRRCCRGLDASAAPTISTSSRKPRSLWKTGEVWMRSI